ncbi:membrane protein [Acinetobacter tandoii]|uniref:trimeric intracellular cation channel family protein n=1 Tax=Acinetobacter TaxID=469 RepID=UPI000C1FEE23|nr:MULTISPECIES: trimeric intracellular cation channel family protein [Acinetobacter]NCI78171.1 trimeric intracellular cation channel family protein [Acinetobacter kanungonis]PJG42689.1 membrane protein [Acinetobacter tandoii]QDK99120.1 trimeric intracellular cation channel family protein [Acinetobacter tandoii]
MLLTIIYIIAITAEAMTGALSAGRRSMDWFGVILIACVTALGGGSVRDVLLGHYPLTWVKHPEYLVLTCCAALFTILIAKWMRHLHNIFLVLDALGLIGFTIIGCQIALSMGHGFVVSAVAGIMTGVSGGILRDILCNDVPLVFRRELYASISFVAVICYWVCQEIGLSLELTVISTLIFGFTLRLIAIYFGLEMPKFIYKDDDADSASSTDSH